MDRRQQYKGPPLYHYTSEKAAKSITQQKVIKSTKVTPETMKHDVLLGAGVYLTSKGPEHGKEAILKNNYPPSRLNQARQEGRADCFFKITPEQIQKELDKGGRLIKAQGSNRDIYVMQDRDDIHNPYGK